MNLDHSGDECFTYITNKHESYFDIKSEKCKDILHSEKFIKICYCPFRSSMLNVIHEKVFMRIYKKDDNSVFEIDEIGYIKNSIASINLYNWFSNISLDLHTNLFLCHKNGRKEELIEKNIYLSDDAVKEFDSHYEINQKYLFNPENDYYYDIPVYVDSANTNNLWINGSSGHFNNCFTLHLKKSEQISFYEKYSIVFFSEKMNIVKNIDLSPNSHFNINNDLEYIEIFDYNYKDYISGDIKNAIIQTSKILDIDGKNTEYFLDIFEEHYYYYFNTLDFHKLLEQDDNITIYKPSDNEKSVILSYYMIASRTSKK